MKLAEINQLLRLVEREIWIVTAASGDLRGGLVATFVSPISIVPGLPRLAVAISRQHQTWQVIESAGTFAVHLLSEDQFDIAWHFGSQSGRDVDKFATQEWTAGTTGSPILKAAPAHLECRIEARFNTGDRTLYLAEVIAGDLSSQFKPLNQSRFLELASPEQRAKLKSDMTADADLDAQEIINWRQVNK